MPIFDDVRGLYPLPESRTQTRESVTGMGDIRYSESPILSSEIPVALPKSFGIGIDTSNTIVDQVFTKINDVFEYIHLPMPDEVKELYSGIQKIEGIIADPLSEGKRLLQRTIYGLTNPKGPVTEGELPPHVHQSNIYDMFDTQNLKGRAPLLPRDANHYSKLAKPGEGGKKSTRPSLREREIAALSGSEWDQAKLYDKSEYLYVDGNVGTDVDLVFKGRDTVENLTMRLNHLWDMKIEPYYHNDDDLEVVPPLINDDLVSINQSPEYYGSLVLKPEIYNTIDPYVPVLAYDMDMKTLNNKELELFSGSSIAVPELIRYNSHLSMQILDDENKRWRRWFQKYSENMYDEKHSTVTPYKNSCLQITIYQYRADWKILSKNVILCTLKNYNMKSDGASIGNADILDVEFSIVGKLELSEDESLLNII